MPGEKRVSLDVISTQLTCVIKKKLNPRVSKEVRTLQFPFAARHLKR